MGLGTLLDVRDKGVAAVSGYAGSPIEMKQKEEPTAENVKDASSLLVQAAGYLMMQEMQGRTEGGAGRN